MCATFSILVLITTGYSAPSSRSLATMVSGETRGLEVPMDFLAGTTSGMGALQIVVNIRTDSQGNIEVITN